MKCSFFARKKTFCRCRSATLTGWAPPEGHSRANAQHDDCRSWQWAFSTGHQEEPRVLQVPLIFTFIIYTVNLFPSIQLEKRSLLFYCKGQIQPTFLELPCPIYFSYQYCGLIWWTEGTFKPLCCETGSIKRRVLPSAGPRGELVCVSWSDWLFGFLYNLFRPSYFKSTADVFNLLSDGQECDLRWATGLPLSCCSCSTGSTVPLDPLQPLDPLVSHWAAVAAALDAL